jgi:hypothetical protein
MKFITVIAAMSVVCGSAFAQTGISQTGTSQTAASQTSISQTGASQLDGEWVGKGSVQLGPLVLACSEIKMKFVGTATLYGIRGASIVCEDVKNTYDDNGNFEIRTNNEIYHNNRKVGAIVENELSLLAQEMGETENQLTLRREGDLLYYYQVVRKPGQRPDYGAVAIMTRNVNAESARP